MLFILLPRAQVSADRIADVLETELLITDPVSAKSLNGSFNGPRMTKSIIAETELMALEISQNCFSGEYAISIPRDSFTFARDRLGRELGL
jgi:hypothetical protein